MLRCFKKTNYGCGAKSIDQFSTSLRNFSSNRNTEGPDGFGSTLNGPEAERTSYPVGISTAICPSAPGCRRVVPDGRHRNGRGRKSREPGAAGRTALRPGGPLSGALPKHQGSYREYTLGGAVRRTGLPGATVYRPGSRWSIRDLSRRKLPLRCN